MAWLKNIKTQTPIPATLLKWVEDESDTRSVADVINAITQATVDAFYPVGSIYMSANNIDPATIFGGTWEKVEGRFLLGAGSGYTLGTTGGEANHTLTAAEMPSHTHWVWQNGQAGVGMGEYGFEAYLARSALSSDARHGTTSPTGDGDPHNNMPPYLVVNIWRRTS